MSLSALWMIKALHMRRWADTKGSAAWMVFKLVWRNISALGCNLFVLWTKGEALPLHVVTFSLENNVPNSTISFSILKREKNYTLNFLLDSISSWWCETNNLKVSLCSVFTDCSLFRLPWNVYKLVDISCCHWHPLLPSWPWVSEKISYPSTLLILFWFIFFCKPIF